MWLFQIFIIIFCIRKLFIIVRLHQRYKHTSYNIFYDKILYKGDKMICFEESIIGNTSVVDCKQFLINCNNCSLDEWLWATYVLHPEWYLPSQDVLPF